MVEGCCIHQNFVHGIGINIYMFVCIYMYLLFLTWLVSVYILI